MACLFASLTFLHSLLCDRVGISTLLSGRCLLNTERSWVREFQSHALCCTCLLPCICAGFGFPSMPVQNPLEVSSVIESSFQRGHWWPSHNLRKNMWLPTLLKVFSKSRWEDGKKTPSLNGSHWSCFCQAMAHEPEMEAGFWWQLRLPTTCQDCTVWTANCYSTSSFPTWNESCMALCAALKSFP